MQTCIPRPGELGLGRANRRCPRRASSRLQSVSVAAVSDESRQSISPNKDKEDFVGAARKMITIHGAQAIYVAQHAATFARDGGHPLEAEEWDHPVAAIRAIASAESSDVEPTLDRGRSEGAM